MAKLTFEQFKAEYDLLKKNRKLMPTPAFKKLFIQRLVKGWRLANKHGYFDDHEDYHAWGYVLTDDIDTDGEHLIHLLSEKQQNSIFEQ